MLGINKNNNNDNLEYISLQNATKFCVYSQEYLSLRARQGKLKSMKLGRNWVTTKEWLQEYAGKVDEYNDSINNNGHEKEKAGKIARTELSRSVKEKIVKDQIIHSPPENLPIIRYPKFRFSLGTLRPGFAAALVLVLMVSCGVFGKESLFKTYNDVAHSAEKIVRNMETVSDDVFTATVNYKGTLGSMPGILSDYSQWVKNSYFAANEKVEEKIGNALLSLAPGDAGEWTENTYRAISRSYSIANRAVEKKISDLISFRITPPRITMPEIAVSDINIGGKISNGLKSISTGYFAANEKVEQKIFQNLTDFREGIKDLSAGFKSETMRLGRATAKAYQFVIRPWREIEPKEPGEKEVVQQGSGEGVVVKRIEVSKVVEPVKEVTRETIQQITKIDDAALAQVRANMVYLEEEISKRLYAPGGVVSQTIYVTEPVSSPKIYQENGEIVLQTLGSGNVILTAATGLQLYGQQVVIESTSNLNPLIYLASPTRINGAVTVAGDITAGNIQATDITASVFTGTTLNLSGSISATGATSTFGGIETTGLKIATGATNNYVLTSDASGYATWQAATGGGGGGTNWVIDGSVMYSTSTVTTIGVATTTPRYLLDVWGDFAVGTSTNSTTPILYVNSGMGGQVGIGTTTLGTNLLTVGTTTPALVIANNGYIGIGTAAPVASLDIATATANGAKVINFGIDASADGSTVYGQYSTIGTGAGVVDSDHRYAYGSYNDVSVAANKGATNKYGLAYGTYNNLNVTGSGGYIIGTQNYSIGTLSAGTMSGMNNYFSPTTLTTGSTLYGAYNQIYTHNLASGTVTSFGVNNDFYNLGSAGTSTNYGVSNNARTESGDTAYHFYIDNGWGESTGGTQYGFYSNFSDTDVAYYPIYEASSLGSNILYANTRIGSTADPVSALSVTGSADFSGNVGIGTTTPRYTLDVWGDFAVGTSTNSTTPILYVNSGDGGQVGIGTTTVGTNLFTVGTTTQALFIDNAGKLGINGVTYSWPSSQGGASTVLTNDSSGNLTWAAAAGGTNTWDWIISGTTMYSSSTVTTIGVGTTTPRYLLDVWGDMAIGTTTATSSDGLSIPLLYVDSGNGAGKIGIATSSPRYSLDVWGSLAVGTSTSSIFLADSGATGNTPGITIGADISLGSIQIASSSGAITFVDTVVEASASSGTEESYSFQIDSQELFRIYAESNGSGGIQNKRVFSPSGVNFGIGTTTPRYTLDVWGDFAVGTSTNSTTPILYVNSGMGGQVGIGTTTVGTNLFTVGTTTQALFIDNAGKLGINGVTYSWPSSQGGASTVLTNDSSGNLTWAAAAGGSNTWDWIVSGTTMYSSTTVSTVGISTTTPRYTLDVWGDFAVGTSTDTSTPILYVDSGDGGFVGIGTTTVGRNLLTIGTTTPALVVTPQGNVVIGNTAVSATTELYDLYVGGGNAYFSGGVTANGNLYVGTSLTDSVGDLNLYGEDNIYLDMDYTANDSASNIIFTKDGKATELMRITELGYLGIATSSPRSKLDVWGDMAIGTSSAGKWNTGTTTPALYVYSGNGGQVGIGTTTLGTTLLTVGTTTPNLVVANNGYVGIGTTDPGWPLVVKSNSSGDRAIQVLETDSVNSAITLQGGADYGTMQIFYNGATTKGISLTSAAGAPSYFKNTGGLGIATSSPRYLLDVWGDMAVGTSTGVSAPMNYPLLYVDSGGPTGNGVGIGTTTVAGSLLTVGTTTSALVVANNGYVGIGTAGPDRKLDILDTSNPQLRLTYADNSIYTDLQTTALGHLYINPSGGNVGIGTSTPYSKLTINESSDFAFGDFNASTVDTMEGSHLNWHSNNTIYVGTSTESTIVKTGGQSLKIYASTTPEDVVVRKIFTTSQNFSNAMERLSFWIYADKIATSSATTTQLISVGIYSSANASNATTTKQIYIQEEDRWQYEEWTIAGLANATSVDELFFRIDVNDISIINFYIDQIRLYNAAERSGEMFVGKDGSLTIMGRGSVEILGADGSSNLPGIKVDSAVVELGQPLSVNTGGNVGFDYDLEFLNTGLAQITSEGPLKIMAGDSNHAENLTLATGGTGDVIVELTASSSTFMINHGWNASNTIPFIINSETYATTSLDKLGVLFQIISDASATDSTSQDDENVVFEIDAFGGYYYDGTSHASAGDVAENYYIEDENISGGDVVCFSGAPLTIEKCSQSYQNNLIGVVSTRPALLMAADFEKSRAVALAGRVPVKISAENGPIAIGDPLTSASSTPGTAMKATGAGKILGYALEPFNASSADMILAFINLQERGSGGLTVFQNLEGKIEVQTLINNKLATLFSIDEEGALVVDKIKTQQLCVGSVCVTESDFMKVFGAGVISDVGLPQNPISGSPTSTNPVCENGANRSCSSEVGACQIGVQICEQGVWGSCIGAVFPTTEICDEVDNDCDGEVDEDGACDGSPTPLIEEPITTSTEPIITTTTTPDISTSTATTTS
ncbi:MAG: putative metal-binding motif-containing protein [Candidatus Nealsonbacteria bacterium]